jgi:EAL domain-containing protein (putative c-di-GMP-specific phosphodiesterase class I)
VDGHGTHSSAAPAAAKHFCPNSAEGVPNEASWATFRPVTMAQMPASGRPGTILLVDDEPEALRAFERMLRGVGYQVEAFTSAREAIKRVSAGGVHVVVSDISMPEMTGVELLRTIRAYDADLPVVLVTGLPAIDSATDAVEYGAFKYIVKPFEPEVLRSAVERARKLYRLARMKREALRLLGSNAISADRAGLEASFYSALDSMWMAFQPILRATDGSVYGFEALLRTEEPTLIRPDVVVDAAERLNVLPQLGRKVRQLSASAMSKAPPDAALFLNLHPLDLADEDLFDELAPLTQLAARVILEVTERAAIEQVDAVEHRVSQLRERGFRIAVDDLGAGYAGLSSFALLEPEIVKLDVSLLRDIDQSPVKQKLVASMTALCKDMGFLVVAEGIETRAERDCVVSLGCDLLQGFLFARPGHPFPTASWG